MKNSIKRLAKDHVGLRKALPPNYLFEDVEQGQSVPDDLTQLSICLAGPEGTPYQQGLWHLRLDIPLEYPQHPPTATFRTRIFHPNVAEETGAVCLETLKRDWDPKLTLKDILITISCLLIHPNPDSALNQKAGSLIQDDYEAFSRQAKLMTRIHAPVPVHLTGPAESARRRGEDSKDRGPVQKHLTAMNNIPMGDGITSREGKEEKDMNSRPPKRSIDQASGAMGISEEPHPQEDRRRKSPKLNYHVTDGSKSTVKLGVINNCASQNATVMPSKVVFQAQWSLRSQGLKTRARTGIRRL